jgi:molybdopterin converting factor small subunit
VKVQAAGDAHGQQRVRTEPVAVSLVLFASARQAAGTSQVQLRAGTVGEALELARTMFGSDFAAVADRSRIWVNGEAAGPETSLAAGDEVAVLPPVSGG